MPGLGRGGRLWVVSAFGVMVSSACGDDKVWPLDGSVSLGDASGPVRRAQMLTAASNARGQVRLGATAAEFADLLLIDAETQKAVVGARVEAFPEEGDDNGYFVRVSKDADGYRPEIVRVGRGQQRTVPLAASTPDVPGRAVRLSQRVYSEDFLGQHDLAGVTQKATDERRPEIVFVPVLDAASMQSSRFNVYRSTLPETILALRVEGEPPADGAAVRSRARVVSTSGPRRAGARVLPVQVAAAAERRADDSRVAPTLSSLLVTEPDGNGETMVSWGLQDVEQRVLAFEVGVDTTRPTERVGPEARSFPLIVRRGEHFVCVRPVFSGADLDSELNCETFDAPTAPDAANVRVRVRPAAAGTDPPKRRQPMPVEVEVENLGTVDAPPFKIDVVLSRDGRTEGGLGEVRTLQVDGVKAGSTAVRRTEIAPPRDGSIYVVARADSSRRLVETNSEDNLDRRGVEVLPMGDNRSPILSVAGTAVGGGDAGRLVQGQALKLRASADDLEDGDLSDGITWISSRDGTLAQGHTLDTTALSPGMHRVRAQVRDRGRPAAGLPPRPVSFWRRLFGAPAAPTILADEPPETVTAEFSIEVVEPELARAAQSPPVVSAGPDLTTTVGGEVTPLATAQDPDRDSLTVLWSAKDEAGAAVEILDASQLQARFRPPTAGRYQLELSVDDGRSQEKDQLEVLALAPTVNHAPLVSVNLPPTGQTGNTLRAEVTASDEDNDGLTLSYALSRPPGSTVLLADAETRAPAFVPDLPGLYRLTVVADDGRGRTAQAEAVTLVSAPPPDAGADVPVVEPDAAADTRMPDAAPPDLGPIVPQGNGATCGGRGGCQSGNCVDGICCDTPCLGVCSSCNRPGLFGTCGPVLSGEDPRDDCPSSGTCNGAGSCQPLAVRPGTELLLSGKTVELAGEPNSRGDADPDQEGRVATACDPVSGYCAFMKMTGGQTGPIEAELFVVDGRGQAPLRPTLVSSGVNPYSGAAANGRVGFVRGTLLYATLNGAVSAWRPGWTAPQILSQSQVTASSASCVVSPSGSHAACLGNRQPSGTEGETYDLQLGHLTDGGTLLPTVKSFYRAHADRHSEPPAFSPDGIWLATVGRATAAAVTAIELWPVAGGAAVPVIEESGLDTHLQFSPDSVWLGFMRSVTQEGLEESGTLAIANVSATPSVSNLVTGCNGFGWWQPPGGATQLVFMDGVVNEVGRLNRIADLSNPQPMLVIDKVSPGFLVFAPAVGRMAFVRDGDGDQQYELNVMELATGGLTELARNLSFDASMGAQFSPGGDKLTWSAFIQDKHPLFLSTLGAGGGSPLPLGNQAMRVEFASTGALVFSEGAAIYTPPPTGGSSEPPSSSTLRVFDGTSYPPRVLQPGVRDYFVTIGEYVFFVIGGQGSSDGLYRVRLGAPPPAASCDPLLQSGCSDGSGCFLRGPGDVTGCSPAGSGTLQSACSTDAACTPGYQCREGQCSRICGVGGAACPSETPYCQVAPANARLGLCLVAPSPSSCDPVRLTGCPTSPQDSCQVQPSGQHVCGTAGTREDSQSCEQSSDCVGGLGCFSDYGGVFCRPYCDTRSPACPAGSSGCRPLPGTWVGYCGPAQSPAPTCNPLQQTGCQTEDACYLDQAGYTTCIIPGPSGLNEPCGIHPDCARGLGCFDAPNGRLCRRYCDPRTPSCPTDNPACVWIGGGPFGFCSPAFSPNDGGPRPPDAAGSQL